MKFLNQIPKRNSENEFVNQVQGAVGAAPDMSAHQGRWDQTESFNENILTECTDGVVLESQLPHKIVNSSFTKQPVDGVVGELTF